MATHPIGSGHGPPASGRCRPLGPPTHHAPWPERGHSKGLPSGTPARPAALALAGSLDLRTRPHHRTSRNYAAHGKPSRGAGRAEEFAIARPCYDDDPVRTFAAGTRRAMVFAPGLLSAPSDLSRQHRGGPGAFAPGSACATRFLRPALGAPGTSVALLLLLLPDPGRVSPPRGATQGKLLRHLPRCPLLELPPSGSGMPQPPCRWLC